MSRDIPRNSIFKMNIAVSVSDFEFVEATEYFEAETPTPREIYPDVDIVWIKDEEKIKKSIKKELSDNEEQGQIATAKKKPVVIKNKFQVVTVKQEFVDDRTESRNTIFVRPDLVAEKCVLPDLRTDTYANTIEDEEIKKLRAKPQPPRLVAAVKEEIKIAQRTPEKIAYKIVTPATPHPIDTFEGWCMRNVSKHEYKPPIIPGVTHQRTIVRPTTSRPNLKREAPYRMTANLRMALEAVDKGANYADTAAIYGFTAERLMHIKKLEKENPDYIFYPPIVRSLGYQFASVSSRDKEYRCPMCTRAYKVQRSLRRHMQIECGKAPKHKCPYCDHCTKYRASILKHIVNIHPEMSVVYGDNGRRANFVATTKQRTVENVIHPVRQNEIYYQYQRQRRSRGQGRYACENCDRRYYELKNLKRHIKHECGRKPTYQCILCPYKSSYKTHIMLHGSVHAPDEEETSASKKKKQKSALVKTLD
ncbi:hypothetical protein TSAR_012274 [Trichomalopsis sarcophagae]|uniref:C2H2-type domain-containing protein n=1 Tax=Trichomalopsis sarcophagae TaxID=543379 RepID=A0A232FND2_9HYME|nr:hypothetical protein TSAR_012274 [Trichomalopsis sarcophagae]